MTAKKYEIDMTRGAILPKLLLFTLPLIAANSLQFIFHAIDLMVIGNFASAHALAAIGATTTVNSVIVAFFAGITVGTNVMAARYYGAKNYHGLHLIVHTSAAVGIWGGLALAAGAILAAKSILTAMDTPPEILAGATHYLRLTFMALPFLLFYNMGAAILRAVGDTRRPLYFLLASAFLKALLNLFFVIVCKFDVTGVALATIISQGIMGLLILRALTRNRGAMRLKRSQIRFEPQSLKSILHLGVPASLQSSSYSISNLLIQSAINSFGPLAIAGNTAVCGLEAIVHVGSTAFYLASMAFVAQNHGAGNIPRVCRCVLICMGAGTLITATIGGVFAYFGPEMVRIFTSDPETIRFGLIRVNILFTTYFIIGALESISGSLRGLGYSTSSMLATVTGVCGTRLLCVLWFFPRYRTLECLYLSYPISWTLVVFFNGTLLFFVCRKMLREQRRQQLA